MSAGGALLGEVCVWLQGDAALAELVVFDAPPARAGQPYVVVEDPVLQQLDGACVAGRIGTLAVQLFDGGERPLRLRALIAAVEDRIETLPAELAGGWRVAGLALARGRVARAKDGWIARSEWAVRVFRSN